MSGELINVSINISNYMNESILQSNICYNFNVNNNITISELKEKLIDIIDDEQIKNIVRECKIYNNYIVELGEGEIVSSVSNNNYFALISF